MHLAPTLFAVLNVSAAHISYPTTASGLRLLTYLAAHKSKRLQVSKLPIPSSGSKYSIPLYPLAGRRPSGSPLVAELTHNTFRDHLVLEYEIPKYDGDLGNPAFFVPLTRAQVGRKVETISRHFTSRRERSWFSDETFLAMARLRGIGCNSPHGLAEAFYVRKIVL